MNQAERRLYLIHTLLSERPSCRRQEIPKDAARQRVLLRGLMNVRPAKQISPEFLSVQDEYLRQELSEAGVTHVEDLQPVSGDLYLWQGDITKLSCGAIVNAANSGMTGCYVLNHACIDNCIHTYAGVQLRLDCAEIMEKTGPRGTDRTGEAHACVQSAVQLRSAHGRPDRDGRAHERG